MLGTFLLYFTVIFLTLFILSILSGIFVNHLREEPDESVELEEEITQTPEDDAKEKKNFKLTLLFEILYDIVHALLLTGLLLSNASQIIKYLIYVGGITCLQMILTFIDPNRYSDFEDAIKNTSEESGIPLSFNRAVLFQFITILLGALIGGVLIVFGIMPLFEQ